MLPLLGSSLAHPLPPSQWHNGTTPGRGDVPTRGGRLPWINLQTVLAPTQASSLPAMAQVGVYHTTQEVLDSVAEIGKSCHTSFKMETHGNSSDGKWPLQVVTLGEHGAGRAKALILFGIHGREYLSAEIGLSFMRGLCDSASAAANVLQGVTFTIVPVLNPSGRDYVREGGHTCGDMRKNGNGVDLNRNFDISWTDGSDIRNAEDYRGDHPFSEKESQLVKKLVDEGKPDMFIDVHTGDLSMLIPWNDREEAPPDAQKAAMLALLEHAATGVPWVSNVKPDIGVGALTGSPAYLASGTTGDYAYKAGVKYAFIWETFRLDEHSQGSNAAHHMNLVQWSDDAQHQRQRRAGRNRPKHLLPVGMAPTNAPAEFVGDDCFKFFNPVSTAMLSQYTAQWKMALMRASQYLGDEALLQAQRAGA